MMYWYFVVAQTGHPDPVSPWAGRAQRVWHIRANDHDEATRLAHIRAIRDTNQRPIDVYVYDINVEAPRAKTVKVYSPADHIPTIGMCQHTTIGVPL